jgi:hypothetical protein
MAFLITTLTLLTPFAFTEVEQPSTAATKPLAEAQKPVGELSLKEHFPAIDDMRVGGLLRAYIDVADSDLSATGEDISGVRLYDAQIWFQAELYGYELFIRADAANASAFPPIETTSGVGPLELLDAYVRKDFAEDFAFFFGQFKCPLVTSANVGDGNLAMIERTRIGQLFSAPGAYQPGVAITYDHGPFHAKLVGQNGADGAADGHGLVARAEYRMGEGPRLQEGAFGAPEGFNATFGAGYFSDDSDVGGEDFGSAWTVDMYATMNALSLEAEILGADEELASRALGNTADDALPWDVTVGYLFLPDWEAFLRYQDLDNEASATLASLGLNYYVAGHSAKWQAGFTSYDDDAIDGSIFQVGFSVGLSQPSAN